MIIGIERETEKQISRVHEEEIKLRQIIMEG